MESKEGSSVTVTGNKDDEVAVTMTAREASAAFRGGLFDDCSDLLLQLLSQKNKDPKVLHNLAVVGYFKDGCSDLKKLLQDFENVETQSDEFARASGKHADSVSNMGCLLLLFNMAVIRFSLREYDKAFSLLKSVYDMIESLDEAAATRVCLLFLDIALTTHDPQKFLDVIKYMEKAFGVGNSTVQGDHGSSMQGSSDLISKSSSLSSITAVLDYSNSDAVVNTNASEGSSVSRTQSEENLESLISDMKVQNPTRQYVVQTPNGYKRTPTDQFISPSDLKLEVQLYKVQFLLLTRNLKAAKREVKASIPMSLACGKDSSVALLLKSQLEYDRGNYSKAIKLLMATNRNERGMSIIHNNNLGCIFYRLGKYHSSSIFFSRALNTALSLRKENPSNLSILLQDKSLEIIYNCGIHYLARGDPILAAHCFKKVSLFFHDRPLLWLRIAECCLLAYDKKFISSQKDGCEVNVRVIGEGKWRQLAMDTDTFGSNTDFIMNENDKQPMLSLSKARQYLLNALYLLDNSESKHVKLEENEVTEAQLKISNNKNVTSVDSKTLNLKVSSGQISSNGEGKEQKDPKAAMVSSIVDYKDVCKRENHMLRQALLADLAFVELELGNLMKALSTARSLLELKEISKIYVFLGNIYAAESLCLLNRPMEAAELFLTYLSSDNNFELPYNEEECDKWRVEKTLDCEDHIVRKSSPDELQDVVLMDPEAARGVLYINRAVLYTLVEDYEQARQHAIEGLSKLPNSRDAILTAIFVDLAMGNTQAALARLKRSNHIRFLPNKLKLRSSC